MQENNFTWKGVCYVSTQLNVLHQYISKYAKPVHI